MCNFKVIEHSGTGYVVECNCCQSLRVAFGNVAITFAKDKFWAFADMIAAHAKDKQNEPEREVKNIYVQSPCKNIALVLSVNELNALDDLLCEAQLSLKVNELLETQTL